MNKKNFTVYFTVAGTGEKKKTIVEAVSPRSAANKFKTAKGNGYSIINVAEAKIMEKPGSKKTMTKSEAMKEDKSFYAEEDDGTWCVFGSSSGFCYECGPRGGEAAAKKIAKEMTDKKKSEKISEGDADYRKMNDRTQNSSTYHKKDGTPVRAKLKKDTANQVKDAKDEISEDAVLKSLDGLMNRLQVIESKLNEYHPNSLTFAGDGISPFADRTTAPNSIVADIKPEEISVVMALWFQSSKWEGASSDSDKIWAILSCRGTYIVTWGKRNGSQSKGTRNWQYQIKPRSEAIAKSFEKTKKGYFPVIKDDQVVRNTGASLVPFLKNVGANVFNNEEFKKLLSQPIDNFASLATESVQLKEWGDFDEDDDVIQDAQDAFWAVIAGAHPEIKSGDFPPDADFEFESACRKAVGIWVEGNRPHQDEDETDMINNLNAMESVNLRKKVIKEGTWAMPNTVQKANKLALLFANPIPYSNAEDVLYKLIGDDELFDDICDSKEYHGGELANSDARPTIARKIAEWLDEGIPTGFKTWSQPWEPQAVKILQNLVRKYR